jgi:hypothetical protein
LKQQKGECESKRLEELRIQRDSNVRNERKRNLKEGKRKQKKSIQKRGEDYRYFSERVLTLILH